MSNITVKTKSIQGFTLNVDERPVEDTSYRIKVRVILSDGSTKETSKSLNVKKWTPSANPGDVLLDDMTWVSPIIASDGYTVESVTIPEGRTPIAVCIVPTKHMDDSKARWMSLDFMDCDNPETGNSTSSPNMMWGGYGTNGIDISTLPNFDTVPTKAGTMASYAHLGSKTMFNSQYIKNYDATDGLYYSSTSNNEKCPAPFLADGSHNNAYRQGATGDFDGKSNTDKIIAMVTVNWSGSTITNSSSSGNYPAACCCRRYHTIGTNAGDWYLPAMGELGYLMYNAQLIENVLTKINKVTNTNSIYLWSSTEYSSDYARNLHLGNGNVYNNYKTYNGYVRAFLSY